VCGLVNAKVLISLMKRIPPRYECLGGFLVPLFELSDSVRFRICLRPDAWILLV